MSRDRAEAVSAAAVITILAVLCAASGAPAWVTAIFLVPAVLAWAGAAVLR